MAVWSVIMSNGEHKDGITPSEMRSLVNAGKIKPTTMIKRDDMPQWVQAGRVKGLFQSESKQEAAASPPKTIEERQAHRETPQIPASKPSGATSGSTTLAKVIGWVAVAVTVMFLCPLSSSLGFWALPLVVLFLAGSVAGIFLPKHFGEESGYMPMLRAARSPIITMLVISIFCGMMAVVSQDKRNRDYQAKGLIAQAEELFNQGEYEKALDKADQAMQAIDIDSDVRSEILDIQRKSSDAIVNPLYTSAVGYKESGEKEKAVEVLDKILQSRHRQSSFYADAVSLKEELAPATPKAEETAEQIVNSTKDNFFRYATPDTKAELAARKWVQENVKNPSGLKFIRTDFLEARGNVIMVYIEFDAQNDFGAMIRNAYHIGCYWQNDDAHVIHTRPAQRGSSQKQVNEMFDYIDM